MIICFECSHDTKETLDKFLEGGEYKDYSEVISVAIRNLMVLQTQIRETGALVIDGKKQRSSEIPNTLLETTLVERQNNQTNRNTRMIRATASKKAERKQESNGSKSTTPSPSEERQSSSSQAIQIPSIFLLGGAKDVQLHIASPPGDTWIMGQPVPLDRWLFGQYNKLLPAKANCRALVHLLTAHPNGVPLSVAAPQIAEQAVVLGDYLARHDIQHKTGRDNALATAFPTTGDNADKGRQRYANQFVASVNTNSQLSGLLIDLKLINYTKRRDPLLQLTEIGWRFAGLHNPVLDGNKDMQAQKFSEEEISLLCEHIATAVPAEDFAYRAILTEITGGANTPETLDTALQNYAPQTRDLSPSFLSSQRSGAVSRMSDLDLVARAREGVRVVYTITPKGQQYAERTPQVILSQV